MPLLEGFDDEQLDPQIREALKRLEVAKDAYANAVASINGQYLISLSEPGASAQADAVRAQF